MAQLSTLVVVVVIVVIFVVVIFVIVVVIITIDVSQFAVTFHPFAWNYLQHFERRKQMNPIWTYNRW